MINTKDFESVVTAVNKEINKLKEMVEDTQKEIESNVNNKYLNVKKDIVDMGRIFFNASANEKTTERRSLCFSIDIDINGEVKHLKIKMANQYCLGILLINNAYTRFNYPNYKSAVCNNDEKRLDLINYFINNWDNGLSEIFYQAFKEAITHYLAEGLRIETENYLKFRKEEESKRLFRDLEEKKKCIKFIK